MTTLPRLYLISDRRQVPAGRDLLQVIEEALAAGVRMVQLREKDLPAAQLYPLALKLRELTRRHQALLLINDRVDLALAVAADGVHLGESSLPTVIVRQLLGPAALIGVSCHSCEQTLEAARDGADFVTFSPIYQTPSKAHYGPPQGLAALTETCQKSPLPVFALGGIDASKMADLRPSGCYGIAVISALIAAPYPASAATDLLKF